MTLLYLSLETCHTHSLTHITYSSQISRSLISSMHARLRVRLSYLLELLSSCPRRKEAITGNKKYCVWIDTKCGQFKPYHRYRENTKLLVGIHTIQRFHKELTYMTLC